MPLARSVPIHTASVYLFPGSVCPYRARRAKPLRQAASFDTLAPGDRRLAPRVIAVQLVRRLQ